MSDRSVNSPVVSATARLVVAAFMMDFVFSMTSLAVQNLGVYVLDCSNAMLGFFATARSLSYAICCVLLGGVSDRFGRLPAAVVGCLGVAAMWVLVPSMGSSYGVLAVVTVAGIPLALYWPSVQAWLADVSGGGRAELAKALGLFNIMWCAGLVLGPVTTGYLWQVDYRLTFYLPVVSCLVLVVLLFSVRRKTEGREAGATLEEPHPDGRHFLRLAWIGHFAICFAGGTVFALFPKLGKTLGLEPHEVGLLLSSYRVGQLAVFLVASRDHRWQYKVWPMVVSQVLAAAAIAIAVGIGTRPVIAAGFACAGACGGLLYIKSLFYALHGQSGGAGKRSGLHEAVLGCGILLGPFVGGLAAQFVSVRSPFWLASAVLVAASVLQAAIQVRRAGLAKLAIGQSI